ncbi:immunoglobulin domain-containing protein [Streptomyces poonensis]|uniref:Ig-like domain-containing protein n=1 Tax=Streptomyces poonensis TaxID=68255 RepID=A0A918QF14_9ACTN|nr:immunoglobulin domain-containing protein [Streptomyces poonensis]GGZ41192.1 hypothetical protein GCM10010365_72350 [Streptomyces poonensis]GLJ91766.1 hypothetical protein GCM10017589_43730 [Streptomyces poonensis]
MAEASTVRGRPGRTAGPRLRHAAALLGAAALATASLALATVAGAADTPRTGLGKDGQKLTVSASANLDPDGEKIRVTGAGYDETKGIYVAFCKDNGDNRVPSPCLGGADMTGDGGASKWIVPEGDTYEGEFATAYGDGGTFDVEIEIAAEGDGLDCAEVTCAVVTRVDHRGSGDRSQDVRVPVTFEGQDTGGGGGGGDGVDVPAGTVSYQRSAEFTTAGRPRDLLLHPDSGKLYVGSDNLADTADVNEQGLYVLDAADGTVRSHISQAPNSAGTMAGRTVNQVVAPLSGDGVVFQYAVRGIGTAKDGDTAARGVWPPGASITDTGPGTADGTVLVAQGAALSEVETATGEVRRTVTLDGGSLLGVDTGNKAAWSAGSGGGQLRRVDTGSLAVTATAALPDGLVYSVEPDPATGNVWVGGGTSVRVYDKDAKLLTTIEGADRPADIAFDAATGSAFVLWQDSGETGSGSDNDGSLAVYDTKTYEEAAEATALPGNHGQSGQAALAVAPGGTAVYATSPAEGKIVKLDRRMSPKVTQAPTDQSAAPGDEVSFVAAAEGAPEPTVRWQVSTDGAQTWKSIEGATDPAYSFTAKAAHDGYEYRAEFTNTTGTTRTAPVTLTVTESGDDGGDDGGDGGGDGDGDGDGGENPEPSGTRTVTGPEGQKLTVTPVNGLATENQTLRISGSGYDEKKGLYVALCVDNGDGELPTPCIGGVDMTGGSHSSAWISSNPPDYGQDLATPYGEGGTFEVELTVDARDEFTDCFEATCVLATRADHTLSGDRSQDVKVPVSFVGQDPVDTDDETGGTDGGGTGGTGGTDGDSGGTSGTGGTGGSTGGTGTTAGGSLASTGTAVLTLASVAALLTAAGWLAYRRSRPSSGPSST